MITGKEDLMQAMVEAFLMEKGTVEFYTAAASRARNPEIVEALRELAGWERKHMRYIEFLYMSIRDEKEARPFEYFMENVTPEEVEGAIPRKYVEQKLEEHSYMGDLGILSTAIEIEGKAYLLYKRLSEEAEDRNIRIFTRELMGWENKHLRYLKGVREKISFTGE
jgi:rubrerythrin